MAQSRHTKLPPPNTVHLNIIINSNNLHLYAAWLSMTQAIKKNIKCKIFFSALYFKIFNKKGEKDIVM